jgi:hypothetical protein
MTKPEGITSLSARQFVVLGGVLMILTVGLLPTEARAVACTDVLLAGETGEDTDSDGFTDFQECSGIMTIGTSPLVFPWCGAVAADGILPTRDRCLDPNSRDLFAIVATAETGSVLPANFNAFLPVTYYGINFRGLEALGLAVHQLRIVEADADRFVADAVPNVTRPKAIRVVESLDPNGTILGNCQWGTPLGLDGCIIYTKRAQNFITSSCGTAAIQTPSGATQTSNGTPLAVQDIVLAYSTYLVLHETGHSLGGLTGTFNSRFGGYHYKPGAGLVMEQAVTYTVKGGKCTFYISPNWNQTLDVPAIRLK